MANRRSVALLAAFVVTLTVVSHAAASPAQTLRGFFSQANRIVLSPDPDFLVEARRNVIRTLTYEVFDFRHAAAAALGPEWQARTPAEREEFIRLFAELLETSYIAMLGSKASMHGGITMDYVGETIEGDIATVRTLVLTRNGSDMPVDYHMARTGGRWLVRDVTIDGLGLVANYRAQFHRVMLASSYADLVARMRARAPDAPPVAVAASPKPASPAPLPDVTGARAAAAPAVVAVEPAAVAAAPASPAATVAVSAAPAVTTMTEPSVIPVADVGQAPAGAGPFWVQVGAFRDDEVVINVMERLRQYPVTLFNAAESTGAGTREPVARVLVGPFSQWTEADAKVRELQAGGFKPFIAVVRE